MSRLGTVYVLTSLVVLASCEPGGGGVPLLLPGPPDQGTGDVLPDVDATVADTTATPDPGPDVVPPDVAGDATGCPTGQVTTIEGCQNCADNAATVGALAEVARSDVAGCTGVEDCTLAGFGTDCAGSCQAAVSFSGRWTLGDALRSISDDYCTESPRVCGYATPDCAQAASVCGADGRCELANAVGGPCTADAVDTAEGCLTCDVARGKARAAVAVILAVGSTCTEHSDCIGAPTATRCAADCPVAIHSDDWKVFQPRILEIDAEYCASYQPTCPYSTPNCSPALARCRDGRCVTESP